MGVCCYCTGKKTLSVLSFNLLGTMVEVWNIFLASMDGGVNFLFCHTHLAMATGVIEARKAFELLALLKRI